jgi:hypothetical protein
MFIFIYILVLCFDTSLSWVYKKDRNQLIDEIIDDGHVEAILVKVAGAGLQPAKHLGKSLREMRSAFAMYVITKSLITTTTTKTYYHHRNYIATLLLPPLPLLLFPLLLPLLHFHLCSWILLQRYSFHAKYGLDVCGEGGEYESLVLDCPLFEKKLSIARWDIVADEEGCDMTVGNLRVSQTYYCYWVTHSKYL